MELRLQAYPSDFVVTNIYGHVDKKTRAMMWIKMATSLCEMHRPRLVLGDFNEIKSNSEKQGGPLRA